MPVSSSLSRGCIPVPRRLAPYFRCRKSETNRTALCIVSSKVSGDVKGALGFISITCICSSFPKVKSGCTTKLTTRPQKSFSILSTTGKALRSLSTTENSCSGPRTSMVLYVPVPLALYCFLRIKYKHTADFGFHGTDSIIHVSQKIICSTRFLIIFVCTFARAF